MPIQFSPAIHPISQEEFHALDYEVTGLAFEVHRDLGPLFLSEKIYQRELARRCVRHGYSACLEEPIEVSFDTFSTT
jgi:hypothetical protein